MAVRNRVLELMAEKQVRDQKPITVAMVARAIGLTPQGFHKWARNEIGEFKGDTLYRLCDYFECDLEDLLYFDPPLKHQREEEAEPG